jgi:hypothetical protein
MARSNSWILGLCLVWAGLSPAQAQLLGDGLRTPAVTNPQAQVVQAEQSAQKLSEQAQARAQQKAWGWSQRPVEPEQIQAADDEEPQLRRSKRSYRSRSAYRAERQRPAADMAQAQGQEPEVEKSAPARSRLSRSERRRQAAQLRQARVQEAEADEPAPRRSRASRRSLRHRSAAVVVPSPAAPTRPAVAASAPAPSSDDKPLPGEKEARQWTVR